jgi:hypothetical protein
MEVLNTLKRNPQNKILALKARLSRVAIFGVKSFKDEGGAGEERTGGIIGYIFNHEFDF